MPSLKDNPLFSLGILLIKKRELVFNLVARDLKGRYKGSMLGFLWTILTPLFMALIYCVFLRLLAREVPLASIIIGVFAWQFTAQCVNSALTAITGNANLVKKVSFPRVILPVAGTLANLVNYLLSLIVQMALLAVLIWPQGFCWWRLLLVLVLVLYQTFFHLGLSLILSSLNVYFRDVQHLVSLFLTAWFFGTPAMYDLSFVRALSAHYPWVESVYMLNPMAWFITAYRALLLPGQELPAMSSWLVAAVLPIGLFLIAQAVFGRLQRNFADLL